MPLSSLRRSRPHDCAHQPHRLEKDKVTKKTRFEPTKLLSRRDGVQSVRIRASKRRPLTLEPVLWLVLDAMAERADISTNFLIRSFLWKNAHPFLAVLAREGKELKLDRSDYD